MLLITAACSVFYQSNNPSTSSIDLLLAAAPDIASGKQEASKHLCYNPTNFLCSYPLFALLEDLLLGVVDFGISVPVPAHGTGALYNTSNDSTIY
uniref:Uncharacterized protein n=1 Tax=Ditylenchus dipsaci TaxID=166011 RepID=A0A915D787_9BILA